MTAHTYKERCLVLRKTKLGEKDLIITFLGEQGNLIKAVAKGARKPGGSYAAKLDLFSVVEGMFAQGKSLDVVCDSKLLTGGSAAPFTLEQTAVATPLAELLSMIAQVELAQPRLFDLSVAALKRIHATEGNVLLTLGAAAFWKVLSQAGFRPSLAHCVMCGESMMLLSEEPAITGSSAGSGSQGLSDPFFRSSVFFSPIEGGVICEECMKASLAAECLSYDAALISWCNYLISERFDCIEEHPLDMRGAFAVLNLARMWSRVHIGKDIKSFDFLFAPGLFDEPKGEKEHVE